MKTESYDTDWIKPWMGPCAYDKSWKASSPYPTNPFIRVNPKELVKAHRMWEKQQQKLEQTKADNQFWEQLGTSPF